MITHHKTITFGFIFTCFVLSSSFLQWGAIPASERAALIDFYNSTNGDTWNNASGWKIPPLHTDGFALPGTEGNWNGITVSEDHVIYIVLMSNNLKGPLPASLGNLSYLQTLQFSRNQLSGSIPPELGNLANLSCIGFCFNQLSGSLPSQLSNLSNLGSLSLSGNRIGGSLPPQLGNLTQLNYLSLNSNCFTGTIPHEWGNLSSLIFLYLNENQLSGSIPEELGNLQHLLRLQLGSNQFSGSIPASLGNLAQLEYLWLYSNHFNGEIPTQLQNLTHLIEVDIGHNCLHTTDASLLTWLNTHDPDWGVHQDECLYPPQSIIVTSPNGGEYWLVNSNQTITWSTSGPIAYVKIEYALNNSNVWTTIIANTANTGSFLWTVPNQTATQCRIRISEPGTGREDTSDNPFCIFTGIPPSERTALIALYQATNGDIWHNKNGWKTPPLYTDGFALPGTEGNWYGVTVTNSHVTQLEMWNNNLSGILPAAIQGLTYLEALGLHYNQISGHIPPQLGNMTRLRNIYIENNQFNGTIPPELGNMPKLERLHLGSNQLTGTIPTQLGNCHTLKYLWLGSNQLTGPIPASFQNLHHFKEFCIPNNFLSGNIPTFLENFTELETIELFNNQLSGPIPACIGNLSHLWYFLVNNNQLCGEFPATFTQLTNLSVFNISYNCLTAANPVTHTWLNTIQPDWALYQNQCNAPQIILSLNHLYFTAFINGSKTGPQKIWINNSTGAPLQWSTYINKNWISCSPTAGTGNGSITVSIDPGNLPAGKYHGEIEVSAPNSANSPQYILVILEIKPLAEDMPPFGEFATPLDSSVVQSSVPVTGWALDDSQVESVKIYREDGSSLAYIGDAVLVEGIRTDVASAYPNYPQNYKAGWGYMMLTYFLPYGDTVYKLHAIATDSSGQSTDLGVKTITVNNATAVKPFGTLDTPAQGETIAGNEYINFGWVLTPLPNFIPANGSSLSVWIDGLNLGHPIYNNYREDIATLFPTYLNSQGAVGYFFIDTTIFANGLHTIQWTATDSAGNTDGIGSRYFTIQNTSLDTTTSASKNTLFITPKEITTLPPASSFILVQSGFTPDTNLKSISPDANNIIRLKIKELEPIHLHFPKNTVLPISSLPVGAFFDPTSGLFSWMPGPGCLGEYPMVFVETTEHGQKLRREIIIKIVPRFQNLKIE